MSDETQEPTLRLGDDSVDGWVEYAKTLLLETSVLHDVAIDHEDGTFDANTEWCVRQFQSDRGLRIDGVIGNQTWAALRGEEPQAVGGDGEVPGTYVEAGIEARWAREDSAAYDPRYDQLNIVAFNTGSDALTQDNFSVEITIDTGRDRIDVSEYRFTRASDDGPTAEPGELIWVVVDNMLTLTNSSSADELADLRVTARMGPDLGGDVMDTHVDTIIY